MGRRKRLEEDLSFDLVHEWSSPVEEEVEEEVEETPVVSEAPSYLPCGHHTHQRVPKLPEECSEKELALLNLKDRGVFQPLKLVVSTHPDNCPACVLKRPPDRYQAQEGGYRIPIPERLRRETRLQDGMGWPGLCTHPETGFYIGGLANDCRYNGNFERCRKHQEPK